MRVVSGVCNDEDIIFSVAPFNLLSCGTTFGAATPVIVPGNVKVLAFSLETNKRINMMGFDM